MRILGDFHDFVLGEGGAAGGVLVWDWRKMS
jgi:hypothetical protein